MVGRTWFFPSSVFIFTGNAVAVYELASDYHITEFEELPRSDCEILLEHSLPWHPLAGDSVDRSWN
ncbi:MAG TPA: hypothetical protein VKU02_09940 [Gemmataceae bacterium]|nr:hypothetical protein [Gemmataceae bacterium]